MDPWLLILLSLIYIGVPVCGLWMIRPNNEHEDEKSSIDNQMLLMDKHDRIQKFIQDAVTNAVYLHIMAEWERIKDPAMFTEEHMRNTMSEIILELKEHMKLEVVMADNDIFDLSYYDNFMIDTGLEVGRNIHKELVNKLEEY